MTKTETYRILHRFFMENGILQKFCNNVIQYNKGHGALELKGKSAKDIIEFVINQYTSSVGKPVFMFVWTNGVSSFFWQFSNEGQEFWVNCNTQWIKFMENNNIVKYELIK